MRARNIKPGLWKDEDLADLPIEARYLFPGLWCLADCEGRLEDRPRLIKSEIYPYDDGISAAKVHALLQMLHDGGFIRRYEIDGKKYIQVVNFLRHQNPHKNEREKGSQIPPLQEDEAVPKKSELAPNNSGQVPHEDGTTRDDSLIPDSLFPDSLIPENGKRIPGRAIQIPIDSGRVPLQSKRTPPPEAGFDFEAWFNERMRRHPNPERATNAARLLSSLPEVLDAGWRAEFERVHELWIASEKWQWKSGARVRPMDELVTDRFWLYPPPPPVMSETEKAWASL